MVASIHRWVVGHGWSLIHLTNDQRTTLCGRRIRLTAETARIPQEWEYCRRCKRTEQDRPAPSASANPENENE